MQLNQARQGPWPFYPRHWHYLTSKVVFDLVDTIILQLVTSILQLGTTTTQGIPGPSPSFPRRVQSAANQGTGY
jgi:hypothetical protein